MALDLKELVKDCLGPLPRVCQEQVLLDMERARMTAEDANAQSGHAKARMANRLTASRNLIEDARVDAIMAAESGGTRENFRVALIGVNNTLVEAWRATYGIHPIPDDTDIEASESEDEQEQEEEDEEAALHCVLCRTSGGHRMYFNMEPQGRWAGLAPGARIVCDRCYRDDMGEVESFF